MITTAQIDSAVAAELGELVALIGKSAADITDHDTLTSGQRVTLELTRREMLALCNCATLDDETAIWNFLLLKAKVEIREIILSGAPARRAGIVAAFKAAVQRLSRRLREITARTLPRSFENSSHAPESVVQLAREEVERICNGELDEKDFFAQAAKRRRAA